MRALPFLLAALSVACGEVVESRNDGSAPDGSDGGGKTELGAPTGTLVAVCPSTPPQSGTNCTSVAGVVCEYGDDPDWACNVVSYCSPENCPTGTDCQFAWMPYAVGPTKCPSPPLGLGAGCPATHADAAKGGSCSKEAQVCAYTEGFCACSHGVWACATPAAGCPPFRPRMGSACSNTNLHCDYGVCPGYPSNAVFDCAGKTSNGKVSGFWTEGCPVCLGSGGSGGGG